ncbi:hypothetical protein OG235_24615 [Streptomyces sp. NBC_00024]|uniref:hypothetical protein n=1 Tax=Streptomyces sp. NBC_00024 TaxID=2903612 RepID=UPI00325465CA
MTDQPTLDTITPAEFTGLQLKAARMEHAVAEYAKLRVQLEDAERERDEHKESYLKACTTIAAMHEAAVGEVRGPNRGVVEDVEDVRLRAEQAEAAIARVHALADRWGNALGIDKTYARTLRATLDEPSPAATEATELEKTTRVFAALHQSAEQDVSRVIALYEQWVKAGPPPLGTSINRWWDSRLAELHAALLNPTKGTDHA